jgi:hypothetical protein
MKGEGQRRHRGGRPKGRDTSRENEEERLRRRG